MAFTFGFYNALNHDRQYDAIEMSRIFDGLITDGVYATVGDRFTVKVSSASAKQTGLNSVVVGSGRAWFNHTWNYNDADLPLVGPTSHILYPRWDAIVLDINSNSEFRFNNIIWVTGVAATSPTKPTMIHTEDHNQYPLCYIYRYPNNNNINASDVTSVIGTEECPYSEGLLTDTKNIAQVENNEVATKAYNQGEYILWHDELYKTVVAIAKGVSIVPYPDNGYNIKRTTISTELYEKFVFDTVPSSGSNHPVTSDGIYKALGNNQVLKPTTVVNEADPSNGKAVITSKGLYAALGNRTALPSMAAPAANGTSLISNGQVYTALGNRTAITTAAPAANGTAFSTNGQIYAELVKRLALTGGTLTGNLTINSANGAAGTAAANYLTIGNANANTAAGNAYGRIRLFAPNTAYRVDLYPVDDITANRNIRLPDKAGTIALTSDVPFNKVQVVTHAFDDRTFSILTWRGIRGYHFETTATYTIDTGSYINVTVAGYEVNGPAAPARLFVDRVSSSQYKLYMEFFAPYPDAKDHIALDISIDVLEFIKV